MPTAYGGLFLLTRGKPLTRPGEDLLWDSTDQFFRDIHRHYDHIIIDSRPVLAGDDTANLAPKLDATLLIARLSHTSARLTKKALQLLYSRQVDVPGIILNFVDTSRPEYYQYSEYYNRPIVVSDTGPAARRQTG